jgi:hypothetical protein
MGSSVSQIKESQLSKLALKTRFSYAQGDSPNDGLVIAHIDNVEAGFTIGDHQFDLAAPRMWLAENAKHRAHQPVILAFKLEKEISLDREHKYASKATYAASARYSATKSWPLETDAVRAELSAHRIRFTGVATTASETLHSGGGKRVVAWVEAHAEVDAAVAEGGQRVASAAELRTVLKVLVEDDAPGPSTVSRL